jgi:hypothetical protein
MYYSISDIRTIRDVKRLAVFSHFFDRETMRYFRTQVYGEIFHAKDCALFVTSDQSWHESPRKWRVWAIDLRGRIKSVCDIHGYPTLQAARQAAREYAANA